MENAALLDDLFELAIALENAAEDFYRGLARLFSHVPEVARFWKLYADEEGGHARWLVALRTKMDPAQLRQPLDQAGLLVDQARALLQVPPETLLQRVHTLEDAYLTAVAMENGETNTIFTFLVSDYDISHRSRDFLRQQIHNHAEKITTSFPEGYREAEQRRAVKTSGN